MNVNGWGGEFALTPALQPVQRVQRDAPVAADLELDVRALVRALPPGKTYHVARCHALPLAHLHLGEVQVQGIEPAAVIDNDARPVGAKRLSHLHHAPGHGADRRSRRYADPDALAHDGGVVGQAIRTEPVNQVARDGPVELPQVAGADGEPSRRGHGRPARPREGGQDIVEPFGVARERREAGDRDPLRGAGLGQAALVSPLERHVPVQLLPPPVPPRPPPALGAGAWGALAGCRRSSVTSRSSSSLRSSRRAPSSFWMRSSWRRWLAMRRRSVSTAPTKDRSWRDTR